MPSANIENTTPFTTYKMRVQAKNLLGKGNWSSEISAQFNFNQASGGSREFEVVDANGDTWMVHELHNTTDEVTVERAVEPFLVLCVAGGQYTGNNNPNTVSGRTGGRGGAVATQEMTLTVRPYRADTIGKGQNTTAAGPTTFQGLTASGWGAAGGQGGTIDVIRNCPSGGPGSKGAGCNGEDGTNFPPDTPQFYGGGGGGGGGQAFTGNSSGAPGGAGGAGGGAKGGNHPGNANWSYSPQPVANSGGGGGGASGVYGGTAVGSNGAAGCVAIAYRIG